MTDASLANVVFAAFPVAFAAVTLTLYRPSSGRRGPGVLVQRDHRWRPYLAAAGARVAVPGLLFWQPPVALGALADGALLGALVGSRRPRPRPNPGRRAWAGRLAATS